MCEPMTIATLATMAVSTALGAVSAQRQGDAAADAAKYQAKVAANNAKMAERSAQDALERGARAEAETRLRGRLIRGSQNAAFAAQGVDLGSQTAVDIAESQGELNELDALTVRHNAAREAFGFRVEGMNYKAQSNLLESQADGYKAEGKMGMYSTILSGAAQMGGAAYNMGVGSTWGSKKPAGLESVKWGTKSAVWNRGY